MKAEIKRMNATFPLPAYQTPGAVAMDLPVREGAVIAPKSTAVLPLNVVIRPPEGHFVLLAARSSLWKRGLMLANSIGIIDEDFSGDGDEYQVVLYNFTEEPVTVEAGDRLTQILMLPYDKVSWQEVEGLGGNDRGAFGTTGT